MADVMVSYSRKDKELVSALHQAFEARQITTWIDWDDLPPTAPVREEILAGIADSLAVIVVLTPDWLASEYCRLEFEHAEYLSKRLIPILVRPVEVASVPPQIRGINWIRFDTLPFDGAMQELLRGFSLNLDRLNLQRRVNRRAETWSVSKDESSLLRGTELAEAQLWLASGKQGEGDPLDLHTRFIVESQRVETLRNRRRLVSVSIALLVMIALASATFLFYRSAEARRKTAQSRLLAFESVGREAKELDLALLLASHAFRLDPTIQAESALLQAVQNHPHLRRILHGAEGGVEEVAISADGTFTAGGDSTGKVLLWRNDTGQLAASTEPGEKGDIMNAVAFSPAGASLVVGSMSFLVRVFTVDGQKLRQTASWKEGSPVQSVAYSPDGSLIAVGDLLGVVHVFDANKPAAPRHTFRPDHEAPALALAFSKTSNQLAIGRGNRHITIHALTGVSAAPAVLDQEGRIAGLAFTFNDRILMAAGDQRIRTWDFKNPGFPPGEMTFPDRIRSFAVTEDGLHVAVGLNNGEVHVASSRNPRDVSVLRGNAGAVKSLALRGSTLVSGDSSGRVMSWSFGDETLISEGIGIHHGIASNATFSPSGDTIASGDSSGRLALWSRADNRVAIHALSDQLSGVDALAFSPDARLLAIGSEDSGLLLWDATAGHALRPVDRSLQGIVAVAFGRNTSQAVAIKADGATTLVRTTDGNTQATALPNAAGRPMSYAVDPERKRLALGTNAGSVGLVDLGTGRYVGNTHLVKTSEVMGIAFLDATHLVGALTDGNLFVWDSAGTDTVRFVPTGSMRLTALAYAPASHLAVVGNNDGIIQLFDTHSWQRIGPGWRSASSSIRRN